MRKLAKKLPKKNTLRTKLRREGKTRWLDFGSRLFEDGFTCIDIADPETINPKHRDRYIQFDLLSANDEDLAALGEFDLIRMQHVFEHFSPEDGVELLRKLARILKPGGYILVTVPDLAIHVQNYLIGYRGEAWFKKFSEWLRVPQEAPASFHFSTYAHQQGYLTNGEPGQAHRWCYDGPGLKFQLERAAVFENVRILSLWNSLAEAPFTHNRSKEDACVIAQKPM